MDEDLNKSLARLKETLNDEIKKVTKKSDITPAELENMTKALCLIEKIKMIEEDWPERGNSGNYNPYPEGPNDWPMPGMSGNYYNTQLSGPGMHTSGTHYRGRPMRSYGMPDHGYSGHSIKDRMIAKLEEMYDEAKTEHEKQIVDEWIDRLGGNK